MRVIEIKVPLIRAGPSPLIRVSPYKGVPLSVPEQIPPSVRPPLITIYLLPSILIQDH
jgi:hypothetical protein